MNRLSFLLTALFAFSAFLGTADAIFDGGVISIPLGTLVALKAAGLLGIKIGAGIGAFGGGRRSSGRSRHGRSAEPAPAPEPIFDGGVITIPSALLGVAALKAIFGVGVIKGAALSSGNRRPSGHGIGKRSAEPIFDGGLITIPVGTLVALKAAGLIGLKIGAAAGSFGGRRSRSGHRGRRSAEPIFPVVAGAVVLPISAPIAAAVGVGALKLAGLKLAALSTSGNRNLGKRSAEPIFDGGIISIPVGTLLALKGIKIIGLAKGLALSRGKRSAEPIFDGGIISIPVTTLLAIKGIAALGAAKGLLLSRGKRSAEPLIDGGVVSVPLGLIALKALIAKGAFAGLIVANQGNRGKRSAEPIFDGGVVTIPTALLGLGALKGLAILKGLALSNNRGKRSAEPIFDGGVISIPVGTLLALKGIGALGLLKGFALSRAGGRRGKRSAEPIFDGGVISIPVGTLLALKAVGALGLLKGAALSSGRRTRFGKRSVDEEEDLEATLFAAQTNDHDDCAKKTVCFVNTLTEAEIDPEMALVRNLFASNDELDFDSRTVEFDLAALLGRNAGSAQCEAVFSQCPHSMDKLFELAQAA